MPTTFRDPAQVIRAPGPTSAPTPNGFDTSGKYWVAGGGAGGTDTPPGSSGAAGGSGGGGGGGYDALPPLSHINAVENTGSGGGGGGGTPSPNEITGAGGSGIVLIAYPT